MTDNDLETFATSTALFVIWSKGRHREEEILRDLGERFHISDVYEITWSAKNVIRNFQRFYADIDVRGIYHSIKKGAEPFIAITVTDTSPKLQNCMTSRGVRFVNSRFLEAKATYRSWAGEYLVHSSENDWESNRDMFMLFGKDMTSYLRTTHGPWDGKVKKIDQDLTGTRGWSTEEELISALNRSVEYVVVPGVDHSIFLGSNELVNILTESARAAHAVMAAKPSEFSAMGGTYRVHISGVSVDVGIRFPGDGFLPEPLAKKLLASRSHFHDKPFYPDKRTAFSAMAYQFLLHNPAVSEAQSRRMILATSGLGMSGWTPEAISDTRSARHLLKDELSEYSAEISKPYDAAVYFNRRMDDKEFNLISMAKSSFRNIVIQPIQAIKRIANLTYWQSRDILIREFPGLRTLKRWVAG